MFTNNILFITLIENLYQLFEAISETRTWTDKKPSPLLKENNILGYGKLDVVKKTMHYGHLVYERPTVVINVYY